MASLCPEANSSHVAAAYVKLLQESGGAAVTALDFTRRCNRAA